MQVNSEVLDFGSCAAETFLKGGEGGLSLYISGELERQMVNVAKDLAQRAIMACGEKYNFDGSEAIRLLGLENVKVERQKPVTEKKPKEVVAKAAFPLPYNGEFNEGYCFALRQNNGLYTQCQTARKEGNSFCKACQMLADKNEGIPEYGTIQQRNEVGVFEYTDPKGRKPVSYTKVMKKYKVSEEQVLAEAGKFGMEINAEHFVAPEADSKRGRPKVAAEKVSEPKGPKGRPKKRKKVLEIAGEEHEDLFAAMVANAQEAESSDEESVVTVTKKKPSEEEKAEKAAKLAAEKAEKDAKLAAEKTEKDAKLAAEKAEKDAKLAAEKAEKAAKLAAEKAEKEAKLAAEKEQKAVKLAAEKAEKEAKKAALEAEKEAKKKAFEEAKAAKEAKKKAPKKAAKEEPAEEEEEEEQVKVDGVKVDGKKYYRSTTGIMYDYYELKVNQNQVVIGKWNEAQQKIEFTQDSDSELEEESEEEN
jgi:chemotaxis protein histidine kinase CheA